MAIREDVWSRLRRPGVHLSTSYYSDAPAQHAQITGNQASHARIRATMRRAVSLGIPVSVGVLEVREDQRSEAARRKLQAMGVQHIHVHRQRGIGRAAVATRMVNGLCGHCGRGVAAIGPHGDVWPCVMSRLLRPVGTVHATPLRNILEGPGTASLVRRIPAPGRGAPERAPGPDGGDCAPAETPAGQPAVL